MPGQADSEGNDVEEFDRGWGCGGDSGLFDSQRGSFHCLELTQTQDAVVDQPAFYHIDQLVVAARVSRQNKEPRVDEIANRVIDDTLHNLSIAELETHPDSVDNGCTGMEIEMIANRVPIKAVYVENRLHILD